MTNWARITVQQFVDPDHLWELDTLSLIYIFKIQKLTLSLTINHALPSDIIALGKTKISRYLETAAY